MQAFYVGFQFDKYNMGEECFYNSRDAMDTLYNFRVSMIQRYTWFEPYKLTSQSIATSINDSWFDCWQFQYDFKETFKQKKENFVDMPDIYLSFIFNLLGNSFQIKSSLEKMIEAQS